MATVDPRNGQGGSSENTIKITIRNAVYTKNNNRSKIDKQRLLLEGIHIKNNDHILAMRGRGGDILEVPLAFLSLDHTVYDERRPEKLG